MTTATTAAPAPAPAGIATPDAPGVQRLRELASALELAPPCEAFLFLRHGQTARNLQRIFQGPEEPLSARGIGQAQVAAALLAHERIASIVCSDMPRAVLTAHLVAQAQAEIDAERKRAREELRKQVAMLAIAGAEKIIERSVDEAANSDIVDKLVAEL